MATHSVLEGLDAITDHSNVLTLASHYDIFGLNAFDDISIPMALETCNERLDIIHSTKNIKANNILELYPFYRCPGFVCFFYIKKYLGDY